MSRFTMRDMSSCCNLQRCVGMDEKISRSEHLLETTAEQPPAAKTCMRVKGGDMGTASQRGSRAPSDIVE